MDPEDITYFLSTITIKSEPWLRPTGGKNPYVVEFDDVWYVVFLLQFALVTEQGVHAVTAAANSVLVFLLQHRAH